MATILVVDDHDMVRYLLVDYLQEAGYTVVAAKNGGQALQRVREQPIHVMLLDMNMPGRHGLDTIRRIRALYPDLATRIILMSGDYPAIGEDAMEELTLLAGAHAIAYKPFNLTHLLALIREQEQLTGFTNRHTFYLPLEHRCHS